MPFVTYWIINFKKIHTFQSLQRCEMILFLHSSLHSGAALMICSLPSLSVPSLSFFFFPLNFMTTPMAHGSPQARDRIQATATNYAAVVAMLGSINPLYRAGMSNPSLCSNLNCCSCVLNPLCHSRNSSLHLKGQDLPYRVWKSNLTCRDHCYYFFFLEDQTPPGACVPLQLYWWRERTASWV